MGACAAGHASYALAPACSRDASPAEIVLEGAVSPGDENEEGPFGEYPGDVVSGTNTRPVFPLTVLTYRQ